jgi:SAM-dependent methyltransferase
MIAKPDWMLDELSSAGRENLDADHVGRYDSKMDADATNEVALMHSLGLDAASTLVEFGAGTGQFTLAAAATGAKVVAVDVSPVMLDALRRKVAGGSFDNVHIVEAGFLTYDAPPGTADFVYSRLALHHLADFWKVTALQRVHELLAPGGVFRLWDVVYDFEPADTAERLEAWCATGAQVPAGTAVHESWGRWEIAEHVRDEHSTYRWLLDTMIERVGFRIEHVEQPDSVTARYVLRRIR